MVDRVGLIIPFRMPISDNDVNPEVASPVKEPGDI
jgi:hypothetical protein